MKLAGILTYMTMVGSESPKSDKDPQKRIDMLVSITEKNLPGTPRGYFRVKFLTFGQTREYEGLQIFRASI